MNEKNLVTFFFIFLIAICYHRQRRHLIEIITNAPSKSIKAAFQMSAFILILACILSKDEMQMTNLIILVTLFCIKVIFSSTIVGLTLLICLFQYLKIQQFSFYEVYDSIISIILWKLSEDTREILTRLSFIWIFIFPSFKRLIDFAIK